MSKNNGTSIARRVARRTGPSQKNASRSVDGSVIKNICLTGAEALLEREQDFLSTLSQVNTLVLNTLLQSTGKSPIGNSKVLKVLNDKFHKVWDLTARCFQTLKKNYDLLAVDIQDIYLMTEESHFIEVYTEYFVAVTSYMVIKGFEKSAKQTSLWKTNTKALMQLVKESSETPINMLLQRVFIEPFRQHIQQYHFQLSKLNGNLLKDAGVEPLKKTPEVFGSLESFISQCLDEALQTRTLWASLSKRLTAALCNPERRLQEDSRNVPVTVTSSRYDRVLLFNDHLAFLQGNDAYIYDLKTVWVDSTTKQKSDPCKHVWRVVTPEEEFILSTKEPQHKVLWIWKLNQLIRQSLERKRDFPLWGKTGEANDPPTCRLVTYTYRNEGRFKNAVYEGDMSWGNPHGKGTLKWPNGRNHAGDFKYGQEDGFGICLIPGSSPDRYHCYKCHWRNGAMQGYGICEYADESVYKGYFKDNVRHGFGTLENMASMGNSFKYMGNWEKDKRSGYGVWESSEKGERYIGMWLDNQRHGPGIVLFHTGCCYQGTFSSNKLVGPGVLITEDGTVYEGEFTEECALSGKGKLTFTNGFTLVGTFTKSANYGLQTQGVLSTSSDFRDEILKKKYQFGIGSFPVEERWQGIFEQFQKFLESGCSREKEESFLGFHTKSSKKIQRSQEYLCCNLGGIEDESVKMEDMLKNLNLQRDPEAFQVYLQKAINASPDPLYKLLKVLHGAFQATYSGMGANFHLLSMAQEEIKHYARQIWEFFRALMAMKAEKESRVVGPEEEELSDELNPHTVILPAILPRFHPDLFMLYMLYHEQEDALYWQGIVRLGHLTDTKLLEFLDVQRQLWPLKEVKLTTNQ
ncbi:PREDICTED: ALS2 C-terminal-like protein, partial [Nanorana parkeri]|uniref:ALS2 C-terminal-like protein n=1 Tax=Nanorana parkeri TaxID=125878 RepID=UPI000854F631